MKKKTINAVLNKKIKEWIETLPEHMQEQVHKDTIVTGGCIASMLLKERVSDYDIYFRTRDTVIIVAQHYITEFIAHRKKASGIDVPIFLGIDSDRVRVMIKSAGVASEDDSDAEYSYFEGRPPDEAQAYVSEVMDDPEAIEDAYEETKDRVREDEDEDGKYRPIFMSTNAITLSNKLQIVLRFYGEPHEIHENFDFIHCTNWWMKKEGVRLNQAALESILARELRYVGSKYPTCSLIRIRKFIKRNWTINAGQIVKMAFQISQMDLNDLNVLEDQLTGVDVAYFIQLVSLLKAKDIERVDSAYLIEIIDRMF